MNTSDKTTAKRILVAIDTSPPGLAALEAAANLAAQLQAELHGLFVEDVNLLRLAGLPFAHEIDLSSGTPRPLDQSSVKRMLRAKADQVRQAIAKSAHGASVRWSFQVTRGRVTEATLAAAAEVDAVIIGRESSPLKWVADIAARTHRRAIVAVFDGTAAGHRVLETAAQLAAIHSDSVCVVVTTPDGQQVNDLRQQAIDWCIQRGLRATCTTESLTDAHALSNLVNRAHGRLVLLNREHPLLDEETIEALVNELDCPIGLVR